MAAMTREEARGALQQLVKLWQGRLGEAVTALHEALSADVKLEGEVGALRAERERLIAAVDASRHEATDAAAALDGVTERVAQLRGAVRLNEAKLEQLVKDVEVAQRQADAEIKKHAVRVDEAKRVAFAEVDRAVGVRRDATEREHAKRLGAMGDELKALQARKDALEHGLADLFGRYEIRAST